MTNELTQHGSFNIGLQDVHDSTVNVTQILGKSLEYKDLLNQLETQRELFAFIPEDKMERRLQLSQAIAQLEAQIEQFKTDVTHLAAEFNRIEINTDRLRRAKAHFEQGEIAAARAVFDSEREQMQDENDRLVREKERYEQDVLPQLKQSSDEFYFRALLERPAYDNPNWLADTCEYFERSIKAYATEKNTFDYADFLHQQNQLTKAEIYYQKYLNEFAGENQFKRATTLNSLACLHLDKNDLATAEIEFKEALTIYRKLADADPETYKPYIAMAQHNLGDLHLRKGELLEASAAFKEAWAIRRELADANPANYKPDLAMTLNGLAAVQTENKELGAASMSFEEALTIYRELADADPETYNPQVAMTLYNLGNLHLVKNELSEASVAFEKALNGYRELAAVNPAAYKPDLAMTLVTLALYYINSAPIREFSTKYALEAVAILQPIVKDVPYTQRRLQTAMTVLQKGWGLSAEEIERKLADASP